MAEISSKRCSTPLIPSRSQICHFSLHSRQINQSRNMNDNRFEELVHFSVIVESDSLLIAPLEKSISRKLRLKLISYFDVELNRSFLDPPTHHPLSTSPEMSTILKFFEIFWNGVFSEPIFFLWSLAASWILQQTVAIHRVDSANRFSRKWNLICYKFSRNPARSARCRFPIGFLW